MEKKEKIKECISIMMIFGGELNRTVVVFFFFFFNDTISFFLAILHFDKWSIFFYLILEFYRILFGEKWKRGREGGIG